MDDLVESGFSLWGGQGQASDDGAESVGVNVDLPGGAAAVPARNRVRVPAGRSYSVIVRLTADELRDVATAAARAGLTPVTEPLPVSPTRAAYSRAARNCLSFCSTS
jgi:hypothetical protein